MAPHSSTLAWKIPWTEEPGGLRSMGSLRVGHDWATSLSYSLSHIGEGNGNPLQCSCLGNPRDGGAWWAAVYGVAQSRTRLKPLSSSSNIPAATPTPSLSIHLMRDPSSYSLIGRLLSLTSHSYLLFFPFSLAGGNCAQFLPALVYSIIPSFPHTLPTILLVVPFCLNI